MESTSQAGISRRGLLAGVTASGVLLMAGAQVFKERMATAAGPGGAATRYPLYVPPTVAPTGYTLTPKSGTVNLGDGAATKALVYNGSLPGPTFRARRGDTATLTLNNQLTEPTTTHWHGMLVSHENDGHPMHATAAGGTYQYSFPIVQRAAMNWYHPHPHGVTGAHVALGLAGAFIINDAEEDALGLPSGDYELPLVLRDASLSKGALSYSPRGGGWLGSLPLVNGTRDPYLNVDTALYRFRVLGGANARIFGLTLSNGAPFTLIGNDGGLLASSAQVARIDVAPGERADILVDFRGLPVGTTVMLRDARSGWDLLEFRVSRAIDVPATIPSTLSTIEQLSNPVTTRTFSFDGMGMINGVAYDMNSIAFQVPFNTVERWRFITGGNAPHPVHVHGASYQIVSRTGGRGQLYPWESGWKDTVLLEDGETVEVLVRFDAYRGQYLMHCHKLEHEDMGMMLNFEVV